MLTESEITELFVRWRKPVRSWARKHFDIGAHADDIAQEVFIRLLRYSDRIVINDPAPFLFRIARNVASEWKSRAQQRHQHTDEWLDGLLIEPNLEPQNAVEFSEFQETVQKLIDDLPTRQRDSLMLHVYEKMTYKQIAETTGLTHRTVLRDLTKAYSTLRFRASQENLT